MAKSYRVTIKREARDDLDGIYSYISRDSKPRARRFVKALRGKILGLKKFPHRGSPCRIVMSDEHEDLRYVLHQGHMIFYEVAPGAVTVLHVTGPGQDWARYFA